MPVLTGETAHSSRPRRPRRRPALRIRTPRRRLAAITAAGVTGAVLVTGAVTGASAAAPAPARSSIITLTGSSSSSAGHLTVRFRYQVERAGKIKPLSISYAGGTSLNLRHPALIVSLRPVLAVPFRQIRAVKGPRIVTLILRIRDTHHFSGTIRPGLFGQVSLHSTGRRLPAPGGEVLEATLASVTQTKRVQSISAPIGMQVGILFGPAIL